MKFLNQLILLSLIISSSAFAGIKGKVTKNVYTSPRGVFRMDVPSISGNKSMPGVSQRIIDETFDGAESVQFLNDFGNNVVVEVYDFPQEAMSKLKGSKNEFQEEMGNMFLTVVDEYKETSPEVLKQECFVDELFGNAYFGVLKIPNSSGIRCVESNALCDSKTGCLISFSKDKLVIIRVQYSPVADAENEIIRKFAKNATPKDPVEELKNQLLVVRKSMQFRVNKATS